MTTFTLPFAEIGSADHARVGGKCASLGEMTQAGVAVPPGFAVTTDAYLEMLNATGLRAEIEQQLAHTDFGMSIRWSARRRRSRCGFVRIICRHR